MATYYFDGAKILAPFTVRSNEPMFDVDTVSLKKQRASQNVQRWELSFNILTTKETEVDSLVNTVQNMDTTSTMVMPQLPSVANLSTITGSPTLQSVAGAGSTTVYDQVLGKNAKRPFLHVRYRASEADDRKMKSWLTGSVGGAATSSLDAMEVHFLSERCLCVQGANNFVLFKGV